MKNFKSLDNRETSLVESTFREYWDKIDILGKSISTRAKNENYVFYDGPATANGLPGLHHMVAKFLKDTICKYQTMQGKKVIRKIGWDTHGLPVEVQVEKKLGFNGKGDIEKYGIKEFNQKCRETVWENESAFAKLTKNMGQFIDLENRYITYDNDYIETEWWILKKFFDENLFYEGHKILPFCTRCGTGLASHEVQQGYKEIDVDTVIVPFKRADKDEYFLVWTTTPWTLISNVALCVNPKEEYILAESNGYKFYVASKLANSVLGDEYTTLETFQGSDLENIGYEQLIPSLSVAKKAFYVTCADYVTMDSGTGIVHLAPAFGADDYEVGKKYGLPFLNPVGEDGCYTYGLWQGQNVFAADKEVIKYLKENDKLFKKIHMKHNYPHCWRCNTPLLYYSKPSYYLEITKIKDKIIENNNKVNWYPSFVGEKRFGNWLENLNDWAISRNRYWGTPLPLWRCECGYQDMIGSRQELIDKAIEDIAETIELHRPFVDDIHLTCPKCGKTMSRTPEVIDCWFDSGAMPFAQYHYPFENMEIFEDQFPADFICEGIDQTRGWFYSLLVISTFVKGVSPYKNVLVNELLLDKYGKKMHKSKGNTVEPFSLMERYGADTIRFYLPYISPVWTPIKFDEDGLKEVYSKFFNPLRNTYNFFALYSNTDNIDIKDCEIAYNDREEIDKWLISKYHNLLKYVTESFDEYDLNKVVRALTNFVSEDLSNWYIRRNRNRFWGSTLDNSKKSVYITTYEVLVGLSKMIAPITPYLSEELYQNLTGEESVHLSYFPKYHEEFIDINLEEKMDTVRTLISIGRNVRESVKIKVREPLSECLLDGRLENLIGNLKDLIMEELNVKDVIFTSDLSKYMSFYIKPNYKVAGPIFGSNIKEFANALSNLNDTDITKLNNNEEIALVIDDVTYNIGLSYVDIRIQAKDGYDVSMENNLFVILNTNRTPDLILEGLAREFISKVQNIRKNEDYNVSDRIIVTYSGDELLKEALTKFHDFIAGEILATEIIYDESLDCTMELNGHNAGITTKKA